MPKTYRNYSKTAKTPKLPFEKERLDRELRYVGVYGLKNKREVWRVQYALAKIRKAARGLLTLDEKDPRRIFEGEAMLNRMVRLGVLKEDQKKLDYVLGLTIPQFLERRLQTKVLKMNLATSIHHARILIRQRHIRVGKQMVNVPSFMVKIENDQHIDFVPTSALVSEKLGRSKKKKAKKQVDSDEESGSDAE